MVIIYIIAVFGWWLYSFVSYTKKEYQLEYNNLKLNALVIKNGLIEYIEEKQAEVQTIPYEAFKAAEFEIRKKHQELNERYKVKTELVVINSTSNLHNLIEVKIAPEEFRAIHRNFSKKQRAFYSEVIFFTILVISGVIWVFGKLESLLNLNKMQNNFLLSVTHEFKTPLTAIKLSAQTLQQRKMDDEMRGVLIQQMVNNSDRLDELLDNVLLATRIDGKSYQFDMHKLDITELIERSAQLQLCEPHFKGKFNFNEDSMMIMGDEISLKLVFSNLFQNAIKYAGAESEITVRYQLSESGFIVSVSDNGRGIDEKEYKAIFKKFYRVGDENVRETKGTGLGLFLVKQILKSHKAEITAQSNKPMGTTFNITFKQNVL